MSRWHFQRTFKALANETLKQYIRSRRLAHALDRLLQTETRIIEIALAAGYESQEAFTRAFKQAFRMTPHEYRTQGTRQLFLRKVELTGDYLKHLSSGISHEPEFIVQEDMYFVGLQTRFYGADSDKNNLASKLPALWAEFLARTHEIERQGGIHYGIIEPPADEGEELIYTAALRTAASAPLPPGMVRVHVAGKRYAHFAHRGRVTQLDHTVNYIYSNWLMHNPYGHPGAADLEIYGAGYHPTGEQSVIHYAIPVHGLTDG
jgi:AraC family transcriptional regulator